MPQADELNTTNPTRRSFLRGSPAGLASAALALSAIPAADFLSLAIERHKKATYAIDAHHGPDDLPDELVDAEDNALWELAETKCDDKQFIAKLQYLMGEQKRANGRNWREAYAGHILAAINLQLTSFAA